MFALLGPFLLKYWKPLAAIAGVLAIVGIIYWKGRIDLQRSIDNKNNEEIIERLNDERRVIDEGDKIRDHLDKERQRPQTNPDGTNNDDLDRINGCILSNDPFENKCT